jgi:hypothetical protein
MLYDPHSLFAFGNCLNNDILLTSHYMYVWTLSLTTTLQTLASTFLSSKLTMHSRIGDFLTISSNCGSGGGSGFSANGEVPDNLSVHEHHTHVKL